MILTLKGRHRPQLQSMILMQWPKDSMHYIQHKLKPSLKKFDICHIDEDLLQKIPMRHPFITFNKDHFPPGIILLTKRTVVPATQQAT